MPAPNLFPLTPPELVAALERGETPATLATAHDVSEQCVRWHIRRLRQSVTAPAARRAEELVSATLAAFAELAENLRLLQLMREACALQLAHPFDGGALDVGPHTYDLEVTLAPVKRGDPPLRRTVHELLSGHDLVSIEGKFTDPRLLLLQVMKEIRQQLTVAVQLADRIHSLQEVEAFQNEVMDAIQATDPDTAARIKGALHQRRAVRGALG